jgi:hypothetical protein
VVVVDRHSRFLSVLIEHSAELTATAGDGIFEDVGQCHQFGTGVCVERLFGGASSATAHTDQANSEQITAGCPDPCGERSGSGCDGRSGCGCGGG